MQLASSVTLLCMFEMVPVVISDPVRRMCRLNQYHPDGQSDICSDCPKCPIGFEPDQECNRIDTPSSQITCIPCKLGTYSLSSNSEMCQKCISLCANFKNQIETKQCLPTQRRECWCKDGWYHGSSGECDKQCCDCKYNGYRIEGCRDVGNNKYCSPPGNDGICPSGNSTTSPVTSSTDLIATERPVTRSRSSVSEGNMGENNNNSVVVAVGCTAGAMLLLFALVVLCYWMVVKKRGAEPDGDAAEIQVMVEGVDGDDQDGEESEDDQDGVGNEVDQDGEANEEDQGHQ